MHCHNRSFFISPYLLCHSSTHTYSHTHTITHPQDAEQREAAAASQQPGLRRAAITWVQGDALELPFSDASFDAATMGYGLRNVADIPQALRELRRVLVPGGKVAVLDFNNSSQPLVDALQVRWWAGKTMVT